jgi:hypothetical protein
MNLHFFTNFTSVFLCNVFLEDDAINTFLAPSYVFLNACHRYDRSDKITYVAWIPQIPRASCFRIHMISTERRQRIRSTT